MDYSVPKVAYADFSFFRVGYTMKFFLAEAVCMSEEAVLFAVRLNFLQGVLQNRVHISFCFFLFPLFPLFFPVLPVEFSVFLGELILSLFLSLSS